MLTKKKVMLGLCILCFFVLLSPVPVALSKNNPEKDLWYTIHLKDKQAGYVNISSRITEKDGVKIAEHKFMQKLVFAMGEGKNFSTERTFVFCAKEDGTPISIKTEFTRLMADGRVEKSTLAGTYNKGLMTLIDEKGGRSIIKWSATVYGFWNLGDKLASIKPDEKKRATLSVLGFDGVTISDTIIESKDMEVLKVIEAGCAKEVKCERWSLFAGKTLTSEWYSPEGVLVMRVMPMFGSHEGAMTLSSKDAATKITDPPILWDFMRFGNVKGAISEDDMRSASAIKYKLILPVEIIKGINWKDERQEIAEQKEEFIILSVKHPGLPNPAMQLPLNDDMKKKFAEYLAPNKFIDCGNKDIKALASQITGGEKDSYKAAVKLAKWVFTNLKKQGSPSYSPASEALKQKQGDCSEHSVLFAALLRASGIPSRVCFGMAYHEGGFFVHMWTEAYIGDWVSIDAHWGQGVSDVGHITLRKSSLKNVAELGEIMKDATSIGGQLKAEILEYTLNGKTYKNK